MKLNHDCVRELMLYLEENLTIGDSIEINQLSLNAYTNEELLYASIKLIEADYLDGKAFYFIDGNCDVSVSSLTWNGHQFLDNVRDDDVWKNTKSVISKFSTVSIGIMSNVASQVISSLIKAQLGI
ncbi:MAG: DUF2513 domain-containing protein [Anaerorhabdus sp.]|uniref:DUF2513 domain-containing protein n=1 Tax=Anaerorhabdus sp. TaxID=1872524 RepID=UPI003A85CFDA